MANSGIVLQLQTNKTNIDMETVITINVVEWVLDIVVIWLAIILADNVLVLYKRCLEWKIKKLKDKQNKYRNGKGTIS